MKSKDEETREAESTDKDEKDRQGKLKDLIQILDSEPFAVLSLQPGVYFHDASTSILIQHEQINTLYERERFLIQYAFTFHVPLLSSCSLNLNFLIQIRSRDSHTA